MTTATNDFLSQMTPAEVRAVTDRLLANERRETLSLAISTADLLVSQLVFLRMQSAARAVISVESALLAAAGYKDKQ